MRFLIPDICIHNTYVHDLAFALEELGHEVIWGEDNFFYSQWQPDVLLSQWPEGYFRTSLGGKTDRIKPHHLLSLQHRLELYQKKTLSLSFIHNTKARPTGITELDSQIKKLYQISYGAAHAFIHLGKNSISELQELYPPSVYKNKPSIIVCHGLNEQLIRSCPVSEDQVNTSNDFRIFVPGAIRTWAEVSFLLRAFVEARIPNKKLVISGGGLLFDGRHPLKVLRRTAIRSIPGVLLFGHRLDDPTLCHEIMKAQILVAPRLWATNSGIPYLAATFKRPCIGPAVGNLPLALDELNGLLFDPSNSSSLARAIEAAYEQRNIASLPKHPCPSWLEIAKQIENFVIRLKSEQFA